jgi:hypothetical protein
MDRATTAVLARLRRGPASTVELQAELYATHVAKQIFDLRAANYNITTIRLRNGTALYQLVSEPEPRTQGTAGLVPASLMVSVRMGPDVPVGAVQGKPARDTPRAAPSRAPVPQFGDPALLPEMRPKGRR